MKSLHEQISGGNPPPGDSGFPKTEVKNVKQVAPLEFKDTQAAEVPTAKIEKISRTNYFLENLFKDSTPKTNTTGIPVSSITAEAGFNLAAVFADLGAIDLYEHLTGKKASTSAHVNISGGVLAGFLTLGYFLSGGGSVSSFLANTGGGLVKSLGAYIGAGIAVGQVASLLDAAGVPEADNKYVVAGTQLC